MDESEKRFERDIEAFLISPQGGYTQFNGQDADGHWVQTRQQDVGKCIYMDVLCEFIAATQPKEWARYTKYYGDKAADKLYHRLETTIANQGLLYVLRNGIEDMGCKLRVCYFKPESDLNPLAVERYNANILGCTRQFRYTPANNNTIDMVLSVNGIPVIALELKNQLKGQDYYETTILEGSTDLNKVYDLRNKVRNYMLYSYDDVDAFNKFMTAQRGKKQDPAALGKLTAMFRPVVARYQELSEEDRFTARDYVRKFNGAYSYITQLVRLHDKDLFNEYQYTSL